MIIRYFRYDCYIIYSDGLMDVVNGYFKRILSYRWDIMVINIVMVLWLRNIKLY